MRTRLLPTATCGDPLFRCCDSQPVVPANATQEVQRGTHAGQRLALFSLPTLCFGVGCSEPGLALSHWALAGTVTTPLPAPIKLPFSRQLFPSVYSDGADADAVQVNAYRVSMEAIPGAEGLQRCDAETELCGHRWLGSATPVITVASDGDVRRVFSSATLQGRGVLAGTAMATGADEPPATAPALVDTVLAGEESGDVESWRVGVGAMAVAVIVVVAVLSGLWAAKTLEKLRISQGATGDSSSVSDGSDGTPPTSGALRSKAVAASQYAWALHPRAVQLAVCSPLVALAAAAGVSAAAVSTGATARTAGAVLACVTAVAVGLALLGTVAVLAYAWWLRPKPAQSSAAGDASRALPSIETVSAVPSSIPVASDAVTSRNSDEPITEQQAAESLSAAAMRASMVLRQVHPNPGRGGQVPRSTATADGSSSQLVTNLELSRFFDGGDGGQLVNVAVPAHGGGVVADDTELVTPREPLRVRTQMDPAMRVAENLSAANLRFVELLRDKYLLPQLQATALRAANLVALQEQVVPADSADGEICKVLLQKLPLVV